MLLCEGFLYPEPRTPKPRGQNTINDIFTKLRTLFNWAFDLELIILPHFQTGA